ncbi:fidgetin isoform X1 [Drosophila bipectinata]|uniref:fidgetin isoform X1 n=1 Tax=Drosophila bipectinata TaxID=42026 RepID=UPI001C8A9E5A|nr:proline-rich transmembrane protein 1 isoform X1 [Drosophila bipectinata]
MSECIAQIPIKAQARCIFQVIPTKIMDRSVTAICLVLLQLLGSGLGFQEKAPVQTSLVTGQARTDKQQQVLDDPLGSGRGIDEHLLKTIGKGGIKLVMASGAPTTTPKPSVQHHYYYPPEDQQHPRQYGYGPFYPPPPPPPQRPWGPQPPPPPPPPGPPGPPLPYYNPYYNGGYGGYYGGYGYGGYGYPGYGGYSYPYYPFYRNSASGTEVDNQLPGADGLTPLPVPGVFQGRTVLSDGLTPLPVPGVFQGRAVLPQNFLEGRNNANIVPLFHLLQMARS